MDAPASLHPTDQTLQSYGLGRLDDASAESVHEHLDQCPACQRRVAELSSDSFLGRIREARDSSGAGAARAAVRGNRGTAGGASSGEPSWLDSVPPELVEHPQYELIRELGRGGMGVVYLAKNRLMDRLEVLKVLNPDMLGRRGTLDRFLREIRSAARLSHPNVVAAYAALPLGRLIVLAMEYVPGDDLAKLIRQRGPLPVAHACYFIHQAALGLQHAYEQGMVHRDIKPGNLILARQGKRAVVKVLDFGLAKATREDRVDGALTYEGQMLGTPDFIAPEQILDAQKADIRADIYSLGCTLYYLLAGAAPFRGSSLYDLLQAHHSIDAVPLNQVRPDVPADLAALVSKMMAKTAAERFQTPGEVARALMPFCKQGGAAAAATTQAEQSAADPSTTPATQDAAAPPVTEAATEVSERPRPVEPAPLWSSLILDREAGSSREESVPLPRLEGQRRSRIPAAIVAAAALGAVLLGVIVYVVTDKGTVKLEFEGPPRRVVLIDGTDRTDNVDEPITLRVGKHVVEVEWGDEAKTKTSVEIRRGEQTSLPIPYPATPRPKVASRPADGTPEKTPEDAGADLVATPGTAAPVGPYVPLFNGKDLDGWSAFSQWGSIALARHWTVREGILHGDGGMSHLFSPRGDYRDFRLRAEVKINDGGNSGIFFRTAPRPGFPNGYEAQINSTHKDPNKTGSLYRNPQRPLAIDTSPVAPDTWFTLEVEAVGDRITIWVDGKRQFSWTDDQKTYARGHIALQSHDPDCHVQFRKLEIMELGPGASAETVETPAAAPESFAVSDGARRPLVGTDSTLSTTDERDAAFPNHSMDGWQGLPGYWHLEDGTLVGAPREGKPMHTFLCSRRSYRDFELRFKVRLKNGVGNSGVQVRSQMTDPVNFKAVGPQCEIAADGSTYPSGSLVTEPKAEPAVRAPVAEVGRVFKPTDYNDYFIRCVGKHVTIRLNGLTTVDQDVSWLPEEGIIAWQLHGSRSPEEVRFKDVTLVRLDSTAGAAGLATTTPAESPGDEGFVPLFNGRDLYGWRRDPAQPGGWRVEDGIVVGQGSQPSHLYTKRANFRDVHVRAEVRISNPGNSGLYVRATPGPMLPPGKPQYPEGYEAQILGPEAPERHTGSLYAALTMVANVKEPPVPAGQWFTLEVIATGNRIVVKVNGKTTVDYLDESMARSSGCIALQLHDPQTKVEFRKIEVKELFGPMGKASAKAGKRAKAARRAPAGATPFQGRFYRVFVNRLTWHEAQAECRRTGGHLAIVRSEEENRFLTTLVASAGLEEAWLGATDELEEGRWVWVDGSPMLYRKWDEKQPTNRSTTGVKEDYLTLRVPRGGAWNDVPDAGETWARPGFVCQWE